MTKGLGSWALCPRHDAGAGRAGGGALAEARWALGALALGERAGRRAARGAQARCTMRRGAHAALRHS